MTNSGLISKIKAEIERLKGQLIRGACAAQIEMETNCKEEAYDELLSFLSTLESEKPIIPDLEKELARFYLKDLCGSEKDEIPKATLHHNFPIMWDDLRDLAHHFAQWGAEHLKK